MKRLIYKLIELFEKNIKIYYPLILSGISIGIFFWEILNWDILPEYINKNYISQKDQQNILFFIIISIFIIIFLFFIIKLFFHLKLIKYKPQDLTGQIKIFYLLFILPLAFHKQIWRMKPLLMMNLTIIFALYVYYLLTKYSYDKFPMLTDQNHFFKVSIFLTLCSIIFYTIYFSYYTILNHYQLQTKMYDLGIYQNAFFNTIKGNFMSVSYQSYSGKCLFLDHYDIVYLLYIPFFYIFPKTETILIIQSLSISLAAIPLFLLTKEKLKSNIIAMIITFLFLLHPANHGANFFDMHQLSFLPLFAFFLFYFLEKKNLSSFIIFILLILSIKEDMFILLVFISIFIYFNNKQNVIFAFYCFSISIVYGLILTVFDHYFGTSSHLIYYEGILLDINGGMSELLKTIITNPVFILQGLIKNDKMIYIMQLFAPLAFLSFFHKKNILLLVYGLSITLLSTRNCLYQISFQYVWYIIPLIFIGLNETLKDIKENKLFQKIQEGFQLKFFPVIIIILFLTLIFSWQYGAVLNRDYFTGGFDKIDFNFDSNDKKRLDVLNKMISMIPKDAAVCASEAIGTHLVNFTNILRFFDMKSEEMPDYLLLFYPNGERPELVEYLIKEKSYKILYIEDIFQLLKKP